MTSPEPQGPRVLVVDDDAPFVIAEGLEREGFRAESRDDVDNAVRVLREGEESYDALVVDMWMGNDREAGLKVLEENAKHWPQPAALVLTAVGSEENTIEAIEFGAAAYMHKPSGADTVPMCQQLAALLRDVLDRRREAIADPDAARRISLVRTIQKLGFPLDIGPGDIAQAPRLSVAGRNLPALWASGDAYDFVLSDDRQRLHFMLCDVCGHGIAQAIIAMQMSRVVRIGAARGWTLAEIDEECQKVAIQYPGEADLSWSTTGVIGVLHVPLRRIEIASSGHLPPSVVGLGRHDAIRDEDKQGSPWRDIARVAPQPIKLEFGPGQSLVAFSDGVSDISGDGKSFPFGNDGVFSAHRGAHVEDAGELCQRILFKAVEHGGLTRPKHDDLTVLALHWASWTD